MFLSRNKKNNVYPCKPRFYYIKVGFKGVKIQWACFRDGSHCAWQLSNKSNNMRKGTFRYVRPTKTQISLRIRAVWLESSLPAWRNFAFLVIKKCPSEESDQTARKRRLIWNFAGRTCRKVRFLTLRPIKFKDRAKRTHDNDFFHFIIKIYQM